MQCLQRFQAIQGKWRGIRQRQHTVQAQPVEQGLAVHPGISGIGAIVVGFEHEDRSDVGMSQRGEDGFQSMERFLMEEERRARLGNPHDPDGHPVAVVNSLVSQTGRSVDTTTDVKAFHAGKYGKFAVLCKHFSTGKCFPDSVRRFDPARFRLPDSLGLMNAQQMLLIPLDFKQISNRIVSVKLIAP